MIWHIDHVTAVVRDVAKAAAFFSLRGFVEEKSVGITVELAEWHPSSSFAIDLP